MSLVFSVHNKETNLKWLLFGRKIVSNQLNDFHWVVSVPGPVYKSLTDETWTRKTTWVPLLDTREQRSFGFIVGTPLSYICPFFFGSLLSPLCNPLVSPRSRPVLRDGPQITETGGWDGVVVQKQTGCRCDRSGRGLKVSATAGKDGQWREDDEEVDNRWPHTGITHGSIVKMCNKMSKECWGSNSVLKVGTKSLLLLFQNSRVSSTSLPVNPSLPGPAFRTKQTKDSGHWDWWTIFTEVRVEINGVWRVGFSFLRREGTLRKDYRGRSWESRAQAANG